MMKTLADTYKVKLRFQRSTRIDTDFSEDTALDEFVLHATGRRILDRLFEQACETKQRAFTWTGPYGSGKSTLALFLNTLLGGELKTRSKAEKHFGKTSLSRWQKKIPALMGKWLVVRVMGQRQNPVEAIAAACDTSVRQYWKRKKPSSLSLDYDHSDPQEVLNYLQACAVEAEKRGGGLLVALDEMGKFLEFAAETDGDVHFLQELAETFSRSNELCILIGILHQSFQEYAGRMDRKRRNEWAKIQGRYVDTPFNVNIEESLDLIGRAITGKKPKVRDNKFAKKIAAAIPEGRLASNPELIDRLCRCHPLHPLTALLLPPISRERFGQNERSIFSFLSSGEPGGFRDFLLSHVAESQAVFTIDQLWDYLQLNLEQTILASPMGHRWAEATEALARAGKGKDIHQRLTKAIALLDIFGRPFSLKSSQDLLVAAFPDLTAKAIKSALKELGKWSVVVFRRHLNAWAVSAGSDIDIDQEVVSARVELGENIEEIISKIPDQAPIIAKRHYHTTGTFRWFSVHILPSLQLISEEIARRRASADGNFILVIPTQNGSDVKIREESKRLAQELSHPCLLALDRSKGKIFDLASELAALERVANRVPEVQSDPVARREIQARISLISSQLRAESQINLESAIWYLAGKKIQVAHSHGLSKVASEVSDRVFSCAPVIKNELINRHKPSSNAVAARRVLMHRMVDAAPLENLGIEKYPPEMGLYLSVLRGAGLHSPLKKEKATWTFGLPTRKGESQSFVSLWEKADAVLEESKLEGKLIPISELYEMWAAPPFGLRKGVMPILALAYLLSRNDELALYDEKLFVPALDDYVVDRLLQAPGEISLRLVRIAGLKHEVFKRLASFAEQELGGEKINTALEAAKELVQFAHRLHPWVKRTRNLSAETRAIRDVLLKAHDPHALLFSDLPTACGFSKGIKGKAALEKFVTKLEAASSELRNAYDSLIDGLKNVVLRTFGLSDASERSLVALRKRSQRVTGRSGDMALDALLLRFEKALSDPRWVESLASLVSHKPSRDWKDNDIIQIQVALTDFAKRFDRVERYLMAFGDVSEGTNVALILQNADGSPREYVKAFELTNEENERVESTVDAIIDNLAGRGMGQNFQTAVLIEALEWVLSNCGAKENTGPKPIVEQRDVA